MANPGQGDGEVERIAYGGYTGSDRGQTWLARLRARLFGDDPDGDDA